LSSAPDWEALKARLFAQNQFAIKLGLDNMKEALRQERLSRVSHRVVLVAGTNGKGTTSAMLSSILSAHGLSVGLYTSPHLIDFHERFRVGGVPAPRDLVLEIASRILEVFGDPVPGSGVPRLTYFEMTTLIARALFERERVDVAIYEVGLGGRLDATNALDPDLCVITTLGFDHQEYLGDTLEEIAFEKAGIMRPGVTVVVGRQEHEGALELLEGLADEKGARFMSSEGPTPNLDASRLAPVQRAHARTAARAASALLADELDRRAVGAGLDSFMWPGRFERREASWRGRALELYIDGAHNPDGLRVFCEWVAPRRPEYVLFGAMADKPLDGMVEALASALDVPVAGVVIDNARAAGRARLEGVLGEGVAVGPIASALDAIPEGVERVAVCGSLYLIGELYAALGVRPEELVTTRSTSPR
jgi:dihydrofolate synthase/folylpolyglutamate synthase